ncbi:MAG: PD-(D/E)XK nuclease family protein [Microvirga sp.]|nr:PD-(D/E)XK nuclease family protein [Microvirga sp.]
MIKAPDLLKLQGAFQAIGQALPVPPPGIAKQFYALHDLQTAFQALKCPLSIAKEGGGLINPWSLAGLGQDEVRNAAILAGLWMSEFGGNTSKRFLASYLAGAIANIDWICELDRGYRVATEVCPMGDIADRVDLVIETPAYLIGVEVKIRAGLGKEQLERYTASIYRRAKLQRLAPWVVLLAPFQTNHLNVLSTSWADVARAGRAAAGQQVASRSYVQNLVASFAEHVRAF